MHELYCSYCSRWSGRLQVLSLLQRARLLRNEVTLDAVEFADEVSGIDIQVALDRHVRQRLDAYTACQAAHLSDVRACLLNQGNAE